MLQTPAAFTPLIRPPSHATPLTFLCHRGQLLLRNSDLSLPPADVLARLDVAPARIHPVGMLDGQYYQTAWLDSDAVPGPAYGWHSLRALFGVADDGFLGVAGRAVQLAEWARSHRYCGACATPMTHLAGERCYQCPACGLSAYPRI
ncbi:MAG: NADH pyrophosphatase zinc ribbon domain-containing protein, partial [Pseudomonadota bacterium]